VDDDLARREGPSRAGQWVQLVVQDSGAGMAPEVRSHLFEPFFTTKARGRGTGLGLATVHGIVTQAGGWVEVRSAPGRGTTIEINLPRRHEAPVRPQPPTAVPSVGGSETVLVVEDDPAVREITARTLRTAGYRVLETGGGAGALELFDGLRGPLQLLVTDVVMPGMDGKALADRLRLQAPALRVLFLSGYTHDIISHHGVLDPGVEFLPKPFTSGALLARVRSVLDAPER
jgi:two-component system cell cycle sensor histidine kinase/response regulator CckA